MEHFLTQLPNTLIGWVSTILIILGSLVLLFNRLRSQDLDTLRKTNKDLNNRVDLLEKTQKENTNQIGVLTTQVNNLQRDKQNLQDLIVLSLDHYFNANPAIALEMKGRLKK